MTDDLDALLRPRPAPADTAVKEALFRRAAGVLAWRRRLRRAATAAVWGLVFAAGVGVGWYVKPEPPPFTPVIPVVVTVPVPVPIPPGVSPGETGLLGAADLELEAEKAIDRAASARLYRQAGDKYLAELNDISSATRCYALYLAEAGRSGLGVTADDSWLLIRIKVSRTAQEKGDDPKSDT
jgi:hypothetical protein